MLNEQKPSPGTNSWKRISTGAFVLLLVMIAVYAGSSALPERSTRTELIIYAYSIQEEAFTQGIFPGFKKYWESTTDTELLITGVFGPSGTLAGQISLGAPADIAIFSSENYLNYLIISRQVEKDLQPLYFGVSPLVIITRPGNPGGIGSFQDLARGDLDLIHADPRSSGVGELSLLAEYGSQYLATREQASALEQVREIWDQVQLLAPSARTALTLFELGTGDALITYEQDAWLAVDRGAELEVILPSPTLLCQPVAVALKGNITRPERAAAQAFLDYLVSPEAQATFTRFHLRPAAPGLDPSAPGTTFTVADLGGWSAAYSQLVKPFWDQEILPDLSLQEGNTIYTTEEK